jgi:hypothetical protein
MATPNIYSAVALTGGTTGSLDSINGSLLNDGDKCLTLIPSTGKRYWHYLDSDSGEAESSPTVISPDSNAGTKRWKISGIGQIDVHDHADADSGGQISFTDLTDTPTASGSSDVNTGTSTSQYITPDALAGSILGTKSVVLVAIPQNITITTGDAKLWFPIPTVLNGMNIVSIAGFVNTASSSGNITAQIYNYTLTHDVLSTAITIEANEYSSYTATTQPVINSSYDHVTTADWIRIDVDAAGTGAVGLWIEINFRLP